MSYLNRPYLKGLTDGELESRWLDLWRNQLIVNSNCELVFCENSPLRAKLDDVFVEANRRGIVKLLTPKELLADFKLSYPRAIAFYQFYERLKLQKGTFLLKFGKFVHLQDLYLNGSLYLRRASKFFVEENLTAAQQDNELIITRNWDLGIIKMETMEGNYVPIPATNRIRYSVKLDVDPFLFCLSRDFNILMPDAFEADACIIYYAGAEFMRRVHQGFGKTIENYTNHSQVISYVDRDTTIDLLPKNIEDVVLEKHISYSYQKEFRFYGITEDLPAVQAELEFNIGSTKDIGLFVDMR